MTTHVLRPQRGQVYKVISDEGELQQSAQTTISPKSSAIGFDDCSVEFWQDSVTLWTASEALTAQQSQECVFPFTVTIPEETSPSARLPQTGGLAGANPEFCSTDKHRASRYAAQLRIGGKCDGWRGILGFDSIVCDMPTGRCSSNQANAIPVWSKSPLHEEDF